MNEVELHQLLTRSRLEGWIERNEMPDWLDWFGLYPAKASVDAAKAQIKAMDEFGLMISVLESCQILRA